MFQSKLLSLVRNVANNLQHDHHAAKCWQSRYVSNTAACTDTPAISKDIPDKLYKKIELEVKGNDPAVLKSYSEFITMAAHHLELTVGRNIALRKPTHDRWTVLKSVHVHKKHRVQYEIRTYFRYIDFLKLTGSTADTILEYIQRNLPEGVAMKVTKIEIQKLPETILSPSA